MYVYQKEWVNKGGKINPNFNLLKIDLMKVGSGLSKGMHSSRDVGITNLK
jgi:hypothetical protein